MSIRLLFLEMTLLFWMCVRCGLGVVLAEDVLADGEAQRRSDAATKPLTIPSCPKAARKKGLTGSRFQGPNRACSITDANSYGGHLELSRQLPSPMGNGYHVLPPDAQGAFRFITESGSGAFEVPWGRQLPRMQARARSLLPDFRKLGRQ